MKLQSTSTSKYTVCRKTSLKGVENVNRLSKLNTIIMKDEYPLPNIEDLLDGLRGAKYFTRLDIISAYNMIRITPVYD